jgi:hypothetical protein
MENLKEQYQCARGLEGLKSCDVSMKKFLDNIKKLGGETAKGASKAKDTIAEATQKL